MRTVALIALVVLIGVAQCGLIRSSKVEKSNFFDDIANAFSGLFGKPAHSWNSQGTHFNVSNSSNSSNHTNNTWNSNGWRFDETDAAPATEAPAPAAEAPAPVAAEKPKKKKGLKNKVKGAWKKRSAKKNAKNAKKAEKPVEQANFFDDIANAFGSLFSKPAHSWNSQGTHFNVSNSSNSSNHTNNTWNSNGWRFDETDAAPATEAPAPAAETPAPVAAEKPKKKKGLKNKVKGAWKKRSAKKSAKNAKKAEKPVEQANFFDDIANAFGSLFSKPTHSWNSQGTHFNVSNSSNSSNHTNTTWNSNGWRFEEEAPATPETPKKKRGFFGKVGGFFKGIWAKRPWAKKKQTETTTEESDFVTPSWNSAGYTFPQQPYRPIPQPAPWNSAGYVFPPVQQQAAWNNQGYRYY